MKDDNVEYWKRRVADLTVKLENRDVAIGELADTLNLKDATIERQANRIVELGHENHRLKEGKIDATAEQQAGAEMVERIVDAMEAAGYDITGAPC